MGGTWASIEELQHIKVLHKKGMNYTAIGKKLNRSGTFVANKLRGMEAGTIHLPEVTTAVAPTQPQTITTTVQTDDTRTISAIRALMRIETMPDTEKLTIIGALVK
jgi:hypothetical protein